jgi:hypothetical protein
VFGARDLDELAGFDGVGEVTGDDQPRTDVALLEEEPDSALGADDQRVGPPDRLAAAVCAWFLRPMEADPESIGETHPAIRAGLRLDSFHFAVRGGHKEVSFTETLWLAVERFRDRRRLTNSPSFALLMACFGLAGMLLYLLLG